MKTVIALDAMGGDYGPKVVVPAAARSLRVHPNLYLILVGQERLLTRMMAKFKDLEDRWRVEPAEEVVLMNEPPAQALRYKKKSSMRIAINLVKQGEAVACVSAGNTGALMATARFVLKTLPHIDRPAIITTFPTNNGREVRVLDLGANVDSKPENLYQFAVMGSIVTSAVEGIENPKVGLLNVGVEDIKGNEQVKRTAELFSQSKAFNYYGYVEGDTIFKNVVDVVVCDGFVGNVVLKAVEGAVKMIKLGVQDCFSQWWSKLLILPAYPLIKHRLIKRIDPRRRNGASLIGLNGIVVKSHGSADIYSYTYAIREAIVQAERDVPNLIKEKVGQVLQQEQLAG